MKKIIVWIIYGTVLFFYACIGSSSVNNSTSESDIYNYCEEIMAITHNIPYRITFENEANAKKPDNPLLAIVWEYHPQGYYILKRMIDLPIQRSSGKTRYSTYMMLGKIPVPVNSPDWEKYIRNDDIIRQLDGMDTAIHEINHFYTHSYFYRIIQDYIEFKDKELQYVRYAKKGPVYSFYINREITILVECDYTNLFYAAELRKTIPEHLRTHRFGTYIYPGPNNEAEQPDYFDSGIYGFLDEFNAYYQGCLFSYNIYPFFRDKLEQTKETWFGYIGNLMGSYNAYAEFKYYILTYLLHAQQLNSDIYDDILDNKPYRIAFTMIDDKFGDLINMIDKRCENLVGYLNQKGFSTVIRDDHFMINNYGIDLMRKDYFLLINEMKKPQYKNMLAALRVDSY
ncbi:MAG: hypothetical protein JW822_02930 [Spirochaetales bacterium]|nr:hypothetical protein [Spirochaetales bacterium]